jgi:hypothetical protein
MPKKKADKETQLIVQQGQAIKDLVDSNGWQEVRKRLIQDVAAIRDITSLTETSDPAKLFQEVAARQIAAEILINWIRGVEGDADQFRNNAELLKERYEENFVVRFNQE